MLSCHSQEIIQRLLDQVRGQRAEVLVEVEVLTPLGIAQIKLDQVDYSIPSFPISPASRIQTRITPVATMEAEVKIII